MSSELALPTIDLALYLNGGSAEEKQKVVADVRDACARYGFFQVRGHGIPLEAQRGLIKSLATYFHQPKEEKMKLSFLKNPCRRGYESSGDSLRDGDALPDSKESFYIGREDPVVEPPGFHGPNQWPNLPHEAFRGPVWDYYQHTSSLGRSIWEILLEGLGHSTAMIDVFAQRPIVQMKMIRYPPYSATLPGQFGVGAHTDFGGVTVLLQQPEKEGLEVWLDERQEWVNVPSIEDVYVINCGDMIAKWSGGVYKSAKHRVVNYGETERLSCATFWHGDFNATNPLDPQDLSKDTVGKLLMARFKNQFSIPKAVVASVA